MKKLTFVFFLCFGGCGKSVPVPPPETFDQMLMRTEGVTCQQLVEHAEGEAPSCEMIVAEFTRARDRVAALEPAARTHKMREFLFFRPERLMNSERGVPLICIGQCVQGYYEPALLAIMYAHERVVRCEALHGLAHIVGLAGWEEIGHATPADPLQFECWREVQDEYKGAQKQ
jgi:hypothetical protein